MSVFTEENRKAFNNLADSYHSKPWQRAPSSQIATALDNYSDWLGVKWSSSSTEDVRLLDYACGTGAITRALGPRVSSIRGIDISDGMVYQYNKTARDSGLSENFAHAIVGDLCGEAVKPESLKSKDGENAAWWDFDVAVIGLGFHHFEDPSRALVRMMERVKEGSGVVVIIDFLPFDVNDRGHAHGHSHGIEHDAAAKGEKQDFPDMKHTIKHSGFTEEQMRQMYETADMTAFDFVQLKEPAKLELRSGSVVERTIFIAKGKRKSKMA